MRASRGAAPTRPTERRQAEWSGVVSISASKARAQGVFKHSNDFPEE